MRILSYCTYLLGVLKVLEEGLLIPGNTLVDVGSRVAEARGLTSLAAKDTVQVRTHFRRVSLDLQISQ